MKNQAMFFVGLMIFVFLLLGGLIILIGGDDVTSPQPEQTRPVDVTPTQEILSPEPNG